jgi:hypothetical protein
MFLKEKLHKPTHFVAEMKKTILCILLMVPEWFHNAGVEVIQCFNFLPKRGPVTFNENEQRCKNAKVIMVILLLG